MLFTRDHIVIIRAAGFKAAGSGWSYFACVVVLLGMRSSITRH